jgi:phage-related tail fiber protein
VGATLTYGSAVVTLDGVTLTDGDRILVKDQTNAFENGIYVRTSSTVWTRTVDADTASDLTGGAFVFVEQGTANADNGYVFTHEGTPTLGSTALTVGQFSGAGQITAGAALSKTGNQLDVEVDNNSIEVTADALNVKALGVTNAMLAGSITRSKLANPFINFSDETSSSGQVQLEETLEFLAGEGINTVALGSTLTISGELATTSNIGVASFNSNNFAVSSGDVTITTIDGGNFS